MFGLDREICMNTRILQFILSSLIILFITQTTFAEECLNTQWSYTDQKEKIRKTALLCFKETPKGLMIYSSHCQKGDCLAVKKRQAAQGLPKSDMYGVGSPHFRDCHNFDGSPILVSLNYKGKTRKTMFCLFNSDQSILNTEAIDLWGEVF